MKFRTCSLNPMAIAITLAFATSAHAVGTGTIVSGNGSINKNQNNTVIHQNTDKMVINWNDMNVGQKESMQFVQPSRHSAVLNRVNSIDPTLIQGALSSNGQVFIVNPNGVLISNGATVNVGSLVASSLDIKDTDFMRGNLNFSGNGKGTVSNDGMIIAKDRVTLMGAGEVSNKGSIHAVSGNATLAAGEDITLYFPEMGKINVKVNKGSLRALVNNGGIIKTPNGSIALTAWATDALTRNAINNTGTLEANMVSFRPDGVYLESMGNGDVSIAGKVSGIIVSASGNNINVKDNTSFNSKINTRLLASKDNGYVKFGKATIDGDMHITADNVLTDGTGHEPTFVNTQRVTIVSGSNDLTIGQKSINNTSQLKSGQSIISESMVNSVSKANAELAVVSNANNVNLDNATLDYGDMAVSSNGNVNLKSAAKGKSLSIFANKKFEQSKGAEIKMTDVFMVSAGESINQTENITAGHYVGVKSYNGNITQTQGKKTSAGTVEYQGNTVKIDGDISAGKMTLSANKFTQGAKSSLIANNANLINGDFDLTSGKKQFNNISINARSLDLNTDSNTEFLSQSGVSGDMNIVSQADVKFGALGAGGKINISANNISTVKSGYYNSYLYSGKEAVLTAKNNINIEYIDAMSDLKLTGKNVSVGHINGYGNTIINASEKINLKSKNLHGKSLTTGRSIK